MSVSTDPLYRGLAARAAARMGAANDSMIRAILAQWQCELGNDAYPPRRNNPGNVARGFAQSVGIPFTVEFPNPQPGNPIVTFGSPEAGADAYAAGLSAFSRYRSAMAKARAGDGAGFLKAVTAAGYGTRYTCAIGVYNRTPAGGSTSTSSGPFQPASSTTTTVTLADLLGLSPDTRLTGSNFGEIQAKVRALETTGRLSHDQTQALLNYLGSVAVGASRSGTGPRLGDIKIDVSTGRASNPVDEVVNDVVGPAIGQLIAAIPGFLVNAAVLILILALAYNGLRQLLSDPA